MILVVEEKSILVIREGNKRHYFWMNINHDKLCSAYSKQKLSIYILMTFSQKFKALENICVETLTQKKN
jgi:hypothetical protein